MSDEVFKELEQDIHNNGFHSDVVPSKVHVGEGQFDIAVSSGEFSRLQSTYSRVVVTPFGSGDTLADKHGKRGAARKAALAYEDILEKGVFPGTEKWFRDQIAHYRRVETSARL
ncbi:hypothetical protein CIHG_09960 [Coccidioides immitis H538.4]|uniref:Uncharacterized protein n=2 Tax=Coccidioides immitis TaxID=5501 RepID=A0A0J8R9Q3_COCIT|nr:hypothetical protein CISG_09209 [Coccidioides immitis RMSCC 3703]KMU92150.1 hypothetical protein CIHG_09960 [Coccidioides immitis H538.4]TPX24582.1 hypothetical protein DIZ76_010013 [Coccidioides immitis]